MAQPAGSVSDAHPVRLGLRVDVVPLDLTMTCSRVIGIPLRRLEWEPLDDRQEEAGVGVDQPSLVVVLLDRRDRTLPTLQVLPATPCASDDLLGREGLAGGTGRDGLREREPQEPVEEDGGVAERVGADEVGLDRREVIADVRLVGGRLVHGGPAKDMIEQLVVDQAQPVADRGFRGQQTSKDAEAGHDGTLVGRELLHRLDQLLALRPVKTIDPQGKQVVLGSGAAREASEDP